MAEGNTTPENMKAGRGIIGGFRVVGNGSEGDANHPTVTGEDASKRGPGRPPKNESSFTEVGKTAEEEQDGQ